MKKSFEELISLDTVLVIAIALTLGMLIGIFYHSQYSIGIRTFIHDVYVKTHPNIEKDSKTLIMDRVTNDTPNLPEKDIFEQPQKKENGFILFIKKVFVKKQDKPQTINDFILN